MYIMFVLKCLTTHELSFIIAKSCWDHRLKILYKNPQSTMIGDLLRAIIHQSLHYKTIFDRLTSGHETIFLVVDSMKHP